MMLEKRGKTDAASQVRYLTHINSSGRHLLDMINELLDVAKIQSGEISIQAEAVELGPAIREAATMISSLIVAKNLELAVVESAAGLVLKADPKRLRQVLLNLLSNAVKFTPEGGAIDISTGTLEGLVEIVVSDTGIGIPPDQLGYIFREFTQVTSGRRKTEEGTGLGLALSRSFVELMGGSIRVESCLGKGSTFIVSLPLYRAMNTESAG